MIAPSVHLFTARLNWYETGCWCLSHLNGKEVQQSVEIATEVHIAFFSFMGLYIIDFYRCVM